MNKKAYNNTSSYGPQSGYGIFSNNGAQIVGGAVGPFTNVQSPLYWLGTEYAPNPYSAWAFNTTLGAQTLDGKGYQWYALAITPGQVSAVPVPGAIWLFGSGLLGLLGLKRRHNAA